MAQEETKDSLKNMFTSQKDVNVNDKDKEYSTLVFETKENHATNSSIYKMLPTSKAAKRYRKKKVYHQLLR